MKRILFPAFLLLFSTAWGQTELEPCGTPPVESEWLKNYQQNPTAFPSFDETLHIPMTIHIVGNDQGGGFLPVRTILETFCSLNEDFAASNILFYIAGEINYIANSDYFNHEEFSTGRQMMFENNVPHTVNSYIVSTAAGACGYMLYQSGSQPLGIAITQDCNDTNDNTWAHEAGHYLSLPHTFRGWEGVENPRYSEPAPSVVNGRQVEKVDGSNCRPAGDGFCDTPPDYLNYRWQCNDEAESLRLQTDPDSIQFQSDGTLFMSYSLDTCANRFSNEQIGAMRTFLLDQQPQLVSLEDIYGEVDPDPDFLRSPIDEETVPFFDEVTLVWEPVANAQKYLLQISLFVAGGTFSFIPFEFVVEDTSLTVTSLKKNKTYYWRVKPFNPSDICTDFSTIESFRTSSITAVEEIRGLYGFSLHPNPATGNQYIHLRFGMDRRLEVRIALYDLSGREIRSTRLNAQAGWNQYDMKTEGLSKGMYLLGLESERGRIFRKLVILEM